jgi:hypothetical protein
MDHYLWRYYIGADGVLDTKIKADVSMEVVRRYRDDYLVRTDKWMTLDLNASLTEEQRAYVVNLRTELRDLPGSYEDAWDAAEAFPDVEDWI